MQIGRALESWQIHTARARPICMNRTKLEIISYIYILSE